MRVSSGANAEVGISSSSLRTSAVISPRPRGKAGVDPERSAGTQFEYAASANSDAARSGSRTEARIIQQQVFESFIFIRLGWGFICGIAVIRGRRPSQPHLCTRRAAGCAARLALARWQREQEINWALPGRRTARTHHGVFSASPMLARSRYRRWSPLPSSDLLTNSDSRSVRGPARGHPWPSPPRY